MKINKNHQKWWTLGTVCFALLMIVLDGNVVNLATPRILKDFSATLPQIEWISNAYLLTFAILLITMGRLGDELGRKKLFVGGLIAFTLGSLLCGISGNTNQLIIFRIIQGIGGAATMPATLSLIATNFEKKERGTAMGLWGAVAGLGIVLGPIVGGYLTDKGLGSSLNDLLHISQYWRYVFFINLPIGLLALFAASSFIPESKDSEKTHRFDIKGIILSSVSVFFLTYAFIEGSKYGWWNQKEVFSIFGHNLSFSGLSITPIFFLISIVSAIVFFFVERSCKRDPLVDIKLFKRRNFSVGNITAAILSFGMMGAFFLLPLFLQIVMGFSPIKTGRVLLPFAVTIMIMAPLAGKLADKVGGKILVIIGMAVMSIGAFYIGHFRIDTEVRDLILPFIIMGIGMGLSQAPLTNTTLLETPEDEIGGASGVLSTARQIGSVMGIAILGAYLQTILVSDVKINLDQIDSLPQSAKVIIVDSIQSQGFSSDNSKLQTSLQQELMNTKSSGQAQKVSQDDVSILKEQQKFAIERMQRVGTDVQAAIKKGFVDSINKTFQIAALIALLGALTALFFRNNKPSES